MIETFSDALPIDIHDLATSVMREVCERHLLVSLAESCTGGLIAAVLTDIEGCSHGFDRGFVAYTDDAKREVLGVSRHILETDSAVSAAAAAAMAEGALARSHADVALSVTGYAGRGAQDEEPGLVFIGLARKRAHTLVEEYHFGDVSRTRVRHQCLRKALILMRLGLARPT